MEKVLVTGASGFIGSHLVKHLASSYQVKALHRKPCVGDGEAEIAIGDLRDYPSLERAVCGVSKVFHCAAITSDWASRRLHYSVNVEGTENILRASLAAEVNRFVHISTNDVFGTVQGKVIDESFPFQKWGQLYPDTKILGEQIVWQYWKKHRLPVTVLYPCWVYGSGDVNLLGPLAKSALDGQKIPCCKNSLVWPTYIENLLEVMSAVAENERAIGNGYFVHDGKGIPGVQFCAAIAKHLGLGKIHSIVPFWLLYSLAFALENSWKFLRLRGEPLLTIYVAKNLGHGLCYSIAKAERDLGWKPKISFEQGLAATMKWVKAKYAGKGQTYFQNQSIV